MRQAKWILQRTDRLREWVRLFFDRRCPTQAAWYRANKILVDAIELELCGAVLIVWATRASWASHEISWSYTLLAGIAALVMGAWLHATYLWLKHRSQ